MIFSNFRIGLASKDNTSCVKVSSVATAILVARYIIATEHDKGKCIIGNRTIFILSKQNINKFASRSLKILPLGCFALSRRCILESSLPRHRVGNIGYQDHVNRALDGNAGHIHFDVDDTGVLEVHLRGILVDTNSAVGGILGVGGCVVVRRIVGKDRHSHIAMGCSTVPDGNDLGARLLLIVPVGKGQLRIGNLSGRAVLVGNFQVDIGVIGLLAIHHRDGRIALQCNFINFLTLHSDEDLQIDRLLQFCAINLVQGSSNDGPAVGLAGDDTGIGDDCHTFIIGSPSNVILARIHSFAIHRNCALQFNLFANLDHRRTGSYGEVDSSAGVCHLFEEVDIAAPRITLPAVIAIPQIVTTV